VEDVEADDAVEAVGRASHCSDEGGQVGVGEVGDHEMDLGEGSALGSDDQVLLLQRPRNVVLDEGGDRVDAEAEARVDPLLRLGEDAAAATADVEDSLTWSEMGELESQIAVGLVGV
jgi:hypothetical protein